MTHPGNLAVKISLGTVDIVHAGPDAGYKPVIARLPVAQGDADIQKRRAYLFAAAPGLANALKNLLDVIQEPNLVNSQPYRNALDAIKACRLPGERP